MTNLPHLHTFFNVQTIVLRLHYKCLPSGKVNIIFRSSHLQVVTLEVSIKHKGALVKEAIKEQTLAHHLMGSLITYDGPMSFQFSGRLTSGWGHEGHASARDPAGGVVEVVCTNPARIRSWIFCHSLPTRISSRYRSYCHY